MTRDSRSPHTLLLALLGVVALAAPFFAVSVAHAQEGALATLDPDLVRWAYMAAAASTAVSSVAASFAVAKVGIAAVGAIAEKPELFGRMVVLVGLAEGIAIYGLIVSILVLTQLGG